MGSKNFGLLRQGFILARALGDEFLQACERGEMPMEALHRLVTPKGRDTMDAVVKVIIDHWHAAEQPQPVEAVQIGGHPFRGTPMTDARNIIEVPDLDATDLTALTEKHCDLTFLDSDYRRWDFWKGCLDGKPINGRGKRFEFMTWEPKREVSSKEVREYFQTRGFSGNAGAFTAWVKERKPQGYYASIPDDNGCWRRSGGDLYAPSSYFGGDRRGLDRAWVGYPWDGDWSFVAFRELSA